MSRHDTVNQKINRNIKWLFNSSTQLSNLFKNHWSIFEEVECKCHFPLCHHDPIYSVNFDNEIAKIKELIDNYNYNKIFFERIDEYYTCVLKTNNMIKQKYRISLTIEYFN